MQIAAAFSQIDGWLWGKKINPVVAPKVFSLKDAPECHSDVIERIDPSVKVGKLVIRPWGTQSAEDDKAIIL